jgi:sarcosine oxidase subunit alpha
VKQSTLPGILLDRSQTFSFTYEGRTIPAIGGQSIAAALDAAGLRIFSRSFKYHRPRGLFCVSGDCPNCLMQVDGRPNVRTCIEPARPGQVVLHQNAWPSLEHDIFSLFDKLDRFLPVGFYYRRFHKPRWAWPIFERLVRHLAGLGRIDLRKHPEVHADVEHLHAEVCIIGSGPAGMAAAEAAANAGANVLVLDRQPIPGGRLHYECTAEPQPTAATLTAHPRIRVLCNTTAFGIYEGNLIGAFQGEHFLKIRANQIVVCTGGRQQPLLFHNNDLPGIMLGRGICRLARLYGVSAGQRAVIVTDNDDGLVMAKLLEEWGQSVAALIDLRQANEGREEIGRWPVLTAHTVLEARGRKHLKAVRVARVDPNGSIVHDSSQELACDLLCLATSLQPANELLLQAGARFRFNDGRWVLERAPNGLTAAGGAAGTFGLQAEFAEGRVRGAQAALALGYPVPSMDRYLHALADAAAAGRVSGFRPSCADGESSRRKRFICLCEDVTEKDLHQAIEEGFDHLETLKRYSTVSMGPCQGKVCGFAASEVCARATGRELASVGTTTSRPPAVSVELAVLAASHHHPIRRTALHHWHETTGAKWLDAGQWKRPETYGDPAAEVRAVRTSVGIIDVSTLGKIELIGPDAGELLDRIYLNRWADLKVGRVRYGAMCNEDGILFDDGVGTRLGPEHFYVTATTGNAEAVYQWLELWKTTWGLKVTILNQTSAFAAMNVAGPQSRALLANLTQLDLSPQAFPYLAMRESKVAGVDCRLFRIGFVGELGYEIHCPSAYTWHLWEAISQAGREFGLRPFGVEAQRILRLEKGHLIVGQDTDALSNPLEAGLDWLVHFDKPRFHGREPLLRLREKQARSRLVGFHMVETTRVVPEGSQVVEQGKPVGRLTSTRYSPTLERSLGLAWIPAARARLRERFLIRCDGADLAVVVVPVPFYDPEGKRLKS